MADRSLKDLAGDPDVDGLEALIALRKVVGAALDRTTSSRDIASLSRQYTQLTILIAEAQAARNG